MRRAFGIYWMVTIVFVLAASHLFAAGVDLTGIGARAQALGGNYRAVANDWSAMYWNPAGMVFTKGLTAGFSLEFLNPVVGYTAAKSLAGQQFSATSAGEVKNEPKTFLVPAGGIYYSTGQFAFGVGVWAPFGLGAKWNLLNTQKYNASYPEYEFEDNLQIIDIHPTVALKIGDKFSIGAGASIVLTNIMIRKPNFTPNPYIYNTDLTSNPLMQNFLRSTLPADAQTSPYDHLLTDTKLEGSGTSYGANFGIMFKPTETFSIGLEAKVYGDAPLTGTINATTYFANYPEANTAIQPVSKLVFKGMLKRGEISEDEFAVLTNYYSGGTNVLASDLKLKTDLPFPKRIGIGFAFSGIQNLLISADVAWTEWSAWGVIDLDDENGNKISELVENWKDGIRAGLGLEYSLSSMKVRGAFYTEPRAAIPATMTPTIPDAGRRDVLTIGVEIPMGPLAFHASYEKMFIGSLTVDQWVLTPDQTGYENMAGAYTMSVNNFMLGFDYQF
ncbi:MAG: hypothetical protein GXO75_06075 [Calditrichaeota bacterium]|nr:hypothetical protein [Calditrichota bacterium]